VWYRNFSSPCLVPTLQCIILRKLVFDAVSPDTLFISQVLLNKHHAVFYSVECAHYWLSFSNSFVWRAIFFTLSPTVTLFAEFLWVRWNLVSCIRKGEEHFQHTSQICNYNPICIINDTQSWAAWLYGHVAQGLSYCELSANMFSHRHLSKDIMARKKQPT
jgi:hypothetical protein